MLPYNTAVVANLRTVDSDSCSRIPGNLDAFILGNTGMKKSGNELPSQNYRCRI